MCNTEQSSLSRQKQHPSLIINRINFLENISQFVSMLGCHSYIQDHAPTFETHIKYSSWNAITHKILAQEGMQKQLNWLTNLTIPMMLRAMKLVQKLMSSPMGYSGHLPQIFSHTNSPNYLPCVPMQIAVGTSCQMRISSHLLYRLYCRQAPQIHLSEVGDY